MIEWEGMEKILLEEEKKILTQGNSPTAAGGKGKDLNS
jgi:hypothetical protein